MKKWQSNGKEKNKIQKEKLNWQKWLNFKLKKKMKD